MQNDRVVIVGNHWQLGGAVAARKILDEVDKTLTAVETPRPVGPLRVTSRTMKSCAVNIDSSQTP